MLLEWVFLREGRGRDKSEGLAYIRINESHIHNQSGHGGRRQARRVTKVAGERAEACLGPLLSGRYVYPAPSNIASKGTTVRESYSPVVRAHPRYPVLNNSC